VAPSETPRHSVSVAAAVVDDQGRVLATRRADNDHWEPPGGVLELDETIEQGVAREVLEETGLVVEPEVLTGVYKNMTRGIVALVFRCRLVEGAARSSDEVRECRWLTADELGEFMDEAYAVRMLDALAEGPARIRTHDGVRLSTRR
jgi:8-oxo-dGTP diphosphatase